MKYSFFSPFLSFHPIRLLNTQKHLIRLKGRSIYLTMAIWADVLEEYVMIFTIYFFFLMMYPSSSPTVPGYFSSQYLLLYTASRRICRWESTYPEIKQVHFFFHHINFIPTLQKIMILLLLSIDWPYRSNIAIIMCVRTSLKDS